MLKILTFETKKDTIRNVNDDSKARYYMLSSYDSKSHNSKKTGN